MNVSYSFNHFNNLFQILDHDKGSHGVPGLYFKYDTSALKVIVKQDRENLISFIVRLCSVIAGIIVISGEFWTDCRRRTEYETKLKQILFVFTGFINTFLQYLFDSLLKKFAPQVYQRLNDANEDDTKSTVPAAKITSKPNSTPNILLQNAQQMAGSQFNVMTAVPM